jgi:hypothetical protein
MSSSRSTVDLEFSKVSCVTRLGGSKLLTRRTRQVAAVNQIGLAAVHAPRFPCHLPLMACSRTIRELVLRWL